MEKMIRDDLAAKGWSPRKESPPHRVVSRRARSVGFTMLALLNPA